MSTYRSEYTTWDMTIQGAKAPDHAHLPGRWKEMLGRVGIYSLTI
jgi:hypothetical protein